MKNAHFGMIGLGTMGRNFLLNIATQNIPGIGYDLDTAKRQLLLDEGAGLPLDVAIDVVDLFAKLERPRDIMLLVPAGPIVDAVIADLLPHLDEGDLVIDGGNSHYTDTERRETDLASRNAGFIGVGVSGGEEGARHGASIMPGGQREFYDRIEPTLQAVAAKVNGEPCVAYMGTSSAGHFVKMVHNGIEYGMMQLLSEAYDHMKRGMGMSAGDMSKTFADWNAGELNSFLVEITATVLGKQDAETGAALVEKILDTAGQKGTGKWTSQAAMDLGIPIPTIDCAVSMRQISAQKSLRSELSGSYNHPDVTGAGGDSPTLTVDQLRSALFAAFIITYAQGMSLLQQASVERSYGLNLSDIARIWRGGCIIRSALLEDIRAAYSAEPGLSSLLLDAKFISLIDKHAGALRQTVAAGVKRGIPAMCFSSALQYFEAFRTERLPANLVQAQRDYFGAHTYQRIDREGTFHTPDWDE